MFFSKCAPMQPPAHPPPQTPLQPPSHQQYSADPSALVQPAMEAPSAEPLRQVVPLPPPSESPAAEPELHAPEVRPEMITSYPISATGDHLAIEMRISLSLFVVLLAQWLRAEQQQ